MKILAERHWNEVGRDPPVHWRIELRQALNPAPVPGACTECLARLRTTPWLSPLGYFFAGLPPVALDVPRSRVEGSVTRNDAIERQPGPDAVVSA